MCVSLVAKNSNNKNGVVLHRLQKSNKYLRQVEGAEKIERARKRRRERKEKEMHLRKLERQCFSCFYFREGIDSLSSS